MNNKHNMQGDFLVDELFSSGDPLQYSLLFLSMASYIRDRNGRVIAASGEDKRSRHHIGQGVYFMPEPSLNEKFPHMGGFGYLFNASGKRLSDIPFRQGGMFSGFKDEQYCSLIAYPKLFKLKPDTMGDHVIVNTKGEIVLQAKSCLDYPYFLKGIIGKIKDVYYNLETGEPIVEGYNSVKSDTFLFVQTGYQFKEPKYQEGVYKIEYATGKYEIFK